MLSRWWAKAKKIRGLVGVGLGCGWATLGGVAAGVVAGGGVCQVTEAQDQQQDQEQDAESAVRIRGRLTRETEAFPLDFAGFELTLEEIVPAPELPLPPNFPQMSVEERQKWFQEFQASDAGKQYQERLAKTDAARRKRTVTADAEGKFSFNDGFAGTCGLFGQKEVTHEGRTYIADFFAEIPVGEGVRFLDLGDLPLTVRRILQTGEAAPDLRLRPTPDGHTDDDSGAAAKAEKSLVKLAKFSGKPVLLCFWTRESLERIREPLSGLLEDKPAGLEVIGVNLDEPSAELDQFLSQQSLAWTVLQTSGLETAPVALDYGILAIPGFCLIDKQGKVLLNDDRFFEAFGQPEATIRSVVAAAIDGQ